MIAMSFREIPLESVEPYVTDDAYVFQQKFDGTRALFVYDGATLEILGRNGAALKHSAAIQHAAAFEKEMALLFPAGLLSPVSVIFDGEIIPETGVYHVFDLVSLTLSGKAWVRPTDPYAERLRVLNEGLMLSDAVEGTPYNGSRPGCIVPVRSSYSEAEKRHLMEATKSQEGFMVKALSEPYAPGERVRHTVKVKNVKTADVIVTKVSRGRNEAGREVGSIEFAVVCDHPSGKGRCEYCDYTGYRPLGACSAVGKPPVEEFDVIEVAYLWWAGGSLVQPRMRRVREDKVPSDCTLDQLPFYTREVV